ncbi:MAG: polyprenyl synthetase family protein [Bacilli bacterium]|nr:polyprenyl synthetase family protein [Bacilli bacterium]
MEAMRNDVNRRLQELIASSHELVAPITHALFPGGKRLRPFLLLCSLLDSGIDYHKGLDVACSLEMIHTYSLIHDDLPAMDNDDLRRGKPTVHIAFGEANAILAGDGLLTDAFHVLANAPLSDAIRVKLVALFATCAGTMGMIRGQVLDCKGGTFDQESIRLIHHLKTTQLFRCALLSAAIILNDEVDPIWDEIAYLFGSAFQIVDDLQDVQNEEETNIVRTIGLEATKQLLLETRQRCLQLIEKKLGKNKTYQLVETVI